MEGKSTYFISLSRKCNRKIYRRWKNMAILLTNWMNLSPSILIFPPAEEKGCFWTGCDVNFRWIIRPQKKSQAQSSVLPRPCVVMTVFEPITSQHFETTLSQSNVVSNAIKRDHWIAIIFFVGFSRSGTVYERYIRLLWLDWNTNLETKIPFLAWEFFFSFCWE